jgi:oligopeptide transport system permease protein
MSSDPGASGVVVKPTASTAGAPEPPPAKAQKARSLWTDAWDDLRRRPLFIVASVLILFFLILAAFPSLFTSVDPTRGDLQNSGIGVDKPSAEAWFGYDVQGRDVYARVIHGARASIIVGLTSTFGAVLVGGLAGILAGYYGKWADTLLSRFSEIFLGLPFVLGAIVILTTFNQPGENVGAAKIIFLVVLTLIVLSWPVAMRIMRSAVIASKSNDYVTAARALGAGPNRIIFRHLLPNTLAPVLVYATIALGGFISAEAALSFLGIGLQYPVVSWGVMISEARNYLFSSPHQMLFPGIFLCVAILAFVMLGDAVREALDPKLR